ncbi:MAG: HAMP domain-containing sensor histidine kinase [Acidimicrobiales bacterium]
MTLRRLRAWLAPIGIGIVGLAMAATIAASGGIGSHDAGILVIYAVVAGALALGLAELILVPLRGSGVGSQAAVAAMAPVVAVALGVVWASSAMFVSAHDQSALFVVLAGAATVGLIAALILGRRVAGAARTVEAMARRIGEGGAAPMAAADEAATKELASLAAELGATAARLAEAQERTAALERSRRELVAWVSHDLRTPLAGIRAMVEALEDGVVTDRPTVDRYHRTMRLEADRLAGLVDDLFELSRIQAGAISLDLERVALDELVSDAVAGASIAAGAKGIDLRGSVGEPSPVVELSTPEMARVVRNLLDNAIRHTPAGGLVSISAGLDDDGTAAVVTVRDACGGIPAADIDQVFEMAYRGDSARTPGDGGAGLGLAVARGLVEAHRGRISVENEAGGCCFTVRLPLSAPAPQRA